MQPFSPVLRIPRRAMWALAVPAAAAAAFGLSWTRPAGPEPVPLAVPPVVTPAADREVPLGMLRIGLVSLSGGGALGLKAGSAVRIKDAATGQAVRAVPANRPLRILADYAAGEVVVKGPGIWARRPSLEISGGTLRIGRRRYPGRIRVALGGTGLQLVNELDVEQYLAGVLPGELPQSFGMEAQKAQAVAARSYALAQRGKHGEFDLCDRTCCQMYIGLTSNTSRALAAVRATRHLCLWDGDRVACAFFSADCGGASTRAENVPLRDKPEGPLDYLQVVRDAPSGGADYCGKSPYHQWTRRLTLEDVEARLNRRPETHIGTLRDLKVTEYDESGRVKTVLLRGSAPAQVASAGEPPVSETIEKSVTGWDMRRALGALTLKSTRLRVDEPQPGTYRFTGSGFGHGLGLCQIGADGMARRGHSYREILAHYYPGARLAALPR